MPKWEKILTWLYYIIDSSIIKWVTSDNSSLLLKIDLQNTQTLQLNYNWNYLQKWLRDQAKMLGLDRQSV